MQGILYEEAALGTFLLVTIVLGGAAGWLSGRAIALSWQARWMLFPAAVGCGLGIRFIHFALFGATFASPQYFVVDTIFILAAAFAGYLFARQRQMARQYGFLQN
jgi:hypothetical protein